MGTWQTMRSSLPELALLLLACFGLLVEIRTYVLYFPQNHEVDTGEAESVERILRCGTLKDSAAQM